MKCPRCSETIDDHSAYCPFCGEALNHKFCAKCGGSMAKPGPSTAKSLLIMAFFVLGITLVVLSVVRPSENILTRTGSASSLQNKLLQPDAPTLVKLYTILSSEETTFAGHTLYSIDARIDPALQRPAVASAAREIAQEKLKQDPASIVNIRFYSIDNYRANPNQWEAHAVAVDMEKNPTFLLPDGAEDLGNRLFIEWKRNITES